jgi:hypothetical protein
MVLEDDVHDEAFKIRKRHNVLEDDVQDEPFKIPNATFYFLDANTNTI